MFSGQGAGKWGRPAMVLAAGIVFVVFLAILGMSGSHSRPAPVRPQPDPFSDPRAATAYVQMLAQTHGDDFQHLSEDDRILLNAMAMGHGRELLHQTVQRLHTSTSPGRPGAAAKRTSPGN